MKRYQGPRKPRTDTGVPDCTPTPPAAVTDSLAASVLVTLESLGAMWHRHYRELDQHEQAAIDCYMERTRDLEALTSEAMAIATRRGYLCGGDLGRLSDDLLIEHEFLAAGYSREDLADAYRAMIELWRDIAAGGDAAAAVGARQRELGRVLSLAELAALQRTLTTAADDTPLSWEGF